MSDLLNFSIPGRPEYIQMVRLAIASIAGTANFDVDAVEDIKVAVAEGCKIVSCHRFKGYSTCYEIGCELEETRMTITIGDKCGDHSLVKEKPQCFDCPKDGDLAAIVMETLMDEVVVNVKEGGDASVRMVKNK